MFWGENRERPAVQIYGIGIRTLELRFYGDIRYDNRSYAAFIQRKSRVWGSDSGAWTSPVFGFHACRGKGVSFWSDSSQDRY